MECQFCLDRAGKWTYEEATRNGVFQRHRGCGCVISYESEKGKVSILSGTNTQGWKIESPEELEEQLRQKQEAQEKAKAKTQQIALFEKYGSLENMMLQGTYEDVEMYTMLQKKTGLSDNEIKKELIQNSDKWEGIFNKQDAKLENELAKITGELGKEEQSALTAWSGSIYADINRYERYSINVNDIAKDAAHKIEGVLEETTLPQDLIARRGISKNTIPKMLNGVKGADGWENDISRLNGAVFTDKGFCATTINKSGGFSEEVTMFIKCPEGTNAAYIAKIAHNEQEKELLLQRNTKFHIIKAEKRPNRYKALEGEDNIVLWCEIIK